VATRILLTFAIKLLSAPFVIVAYIFERLDLWDLNSDLARCLSVVDQAEAIPEIFVLALIAAEDHRSALHPGVDPIAVGRALTVRIKTGRSQGASTIEQQLVRVATGDYQKTLRRKLREQMLAIALSRRRSKSSIATGYLSRAFYGSHKHGVSALRDACGGRLENANQEMVFLMVARLKYPEPLGPSSNWHTKIERRGAYIARRLDKLLNKEPCLSIKPVGVVRSR